MEAVIKVNLNQTQAEAKEIEIIKKLIITQRERINQISHQVNLGAETVTIRRLLSDIAEKLDLEADSVEALGKALGNIVKDYSESENRIANQSVPQQSLGEPSSQQITNPSGDYKEPFQAPDDWIKNTFGLSDDQITLLKLILGFVPGINCIVDFCEILNDYKKAIADDDKVSASEMAGLLLDVGFLALDLASFGSVLKNVNKAYKEAKVANTAAKKASKVAEEAAEKAVKKAAKASEAAEAAEEATGAGKKWYAKKQSEYLEKKAEQAAKEATNASSKRAIAVQKADDAVQNLKDTPKKAVIDNVKSRYIQREGKILPPRKVSETVKNALIEEGNPIHSPIDAL